MFGLRAPRLPARRIMSITHFCCVQCTTHMRRRASCTATMLSSRMSSRRISPSLKPTSLQQQLRLTLTFTQTKKNNIQNAIFQVLRSTLVITQNCRSFAKSVDLRKKTSITQSLTWQVEAGRPDLPMPRHGRAPSCQRCCLGLALRFRALF